jgi:SOS-response transcriptional repressor LexA
VDIRIGIINSPRELSFETDKSTAEIEKIVVAALEGDAKFMKLVDDKNRVYLIALDTFAYIEFGSDSSRRIGFVA